MNHTGSQRGSINSNISTAERKSPEKRKRRMSRIKLLEENEDLNYAEAVWCILGRYQYTCSVIGISNAYFIVTGIQFWISDYLRIVIGLDENTVYILFSIVSVTAPTLGVFTGGKVSEMLGGYTGKHALLLAWVIALFGSIVAIPIPYIDNFYALGCLLWLELFVGGALLPTLIGLMISCIPKKLRNIGNSLALFMQNLLGYIPAPVLYGFINNHSGGKKSRNGMKMLGFSSLVGLASVSFAYIVQYRIRKQRNSQSKEIELDLIKNEIMDHVRKAHGIENFNSNQDHDEEVEIPANEMNLGSKSKIPHELNEITEEKKNRLKTHKYPGGFNNFPINN